MGKGVDWGCAVTWNLVLAFFRSKTKMTICSYLGSSLWILNELTLFLPLRSQLQCMQFSSWDAHKDWTISLPSKESAIAIAIGGSWIAVATSKRYLRVFTVGGVQGDVISVPGHVVTMAAWGSRLSVVYQVPPCEFEVCRHFISAIIILALT